MNSGSQTCLESLLTLEENILQLHLLLYARWDSKQQRKKYKKGHSFAFSKLFKSIQER